MYDCIYSFDIDFASKNKEEKENRQIRKEQFN